MTQTVTAVYENGVLHPLETIVLREHQRVKLQILVDESEIDTPKDDKSKNLIQNEIDAYYALHPMLKEKHLGEHVAIFEGQLVDYDTDGVALSHRIHGQYPERFVLMRQVEEEPERDLYFRSPRFIETSE